MPCSRTKNINEMTGRHLITQYSGDSMRDPSANSTKYMVSVLKNGTSFGPTLFSCNIPYKLPGYTLHSRPTFTVIFTE